MPATPSVTTAARDGKGDGQRRIRLGFVHGVTPFFSFFYYHLLVRANALGIEVIDRPVRTAKEQALTLDELARGAIDVLFYRPFASADEGLLDQLRAARRRRVHLIGLYDTPAVDLDLCTLGAEDTNSQSAVADYVFGQLGGQGKVAYLSGDLRTETGVNRDRGFRRSLESHPGIDLAFRKAFSWSGDVSNVVQARQLAREATEAVPDLKAIITAFDEGALGVVDVLEELGLQKSILVSGFDGTPEALLAINRGKLVASARQPVAEMAARVLEFAQRMVDGQSLASMHETLPCELITRATAYRSAVDALRVFPEVAHDLSRRGQALQNTNRFLATLLDNMPEMLHVKDAEQLRYIQVNKAREAWLRVPPGSQMGKSAYDLFPQATADRYTREEREILANGKPVERLEEEVVMQGFGKRYLNTRKIPILQANGKPMYLMSISEEITATKLAEAALVQHAEELEQTNRALKENRDRLVTAEKMASLGSLLSGVAHELNTPIGNGLMVASTLADRIHDFAARYPHAITRSMLERFILESTEGTDMLVKQLQRAADLISSFKQIAVDQTSAKSRTFSLSRVVYATLLSLSPKTRNRSVEILQDVPADIVMESFPGPLEQVLMHLIDNALTHGFTDRTSGSVSITARLKDAERVELCVADDGVGISAEIQPRIFDPFFTTRSDAGASGLGLSVIRNIVTGLLGGQVEYASSEGKGSRFCILLPLKVATGSSPPRPAE